MESRNTTPAELADLEKLVIALRLYGWDASVIDGQPGFKLLRVAELPGLRSPDWRSGRFVWGERSYTRITSLAKRLDAWCRECGKTPSL